MTPAAQQKWLHDNLDSALLIGNLPCSQKSGLCQLDGIGGLFVGGINFSSEIDLINLRYLQSKLVHQTSLTAEYSLLSDRINGDLRTNNELSFNFGSRHNSGFGLALSANGGIFKSF